MSEIYFSAVRQRRSQLEVKVSILQAISDGARKNSHLMYHTNLSWKTLQGFVHGLEQQGLIAVTGSERRREYDLTERGKRVLQVYTSLRNEFEPLVALGTSRRV